MIVDRVINNNIVSTIDDEGAELILMGRGLGFGTKSGNDIDESKVEKIFKLEDRNDAEQLKQLLLRVPLEEAEVVGDIVSYAKEKIAIGIVMSAAISAFVCGVTEPFEFAFMFLAPALYVVYAALYGIFTVITCFVGFRAGFCFSAGLTDLIFSASLPAAHNTWMIIPLGIAAFLVFYFVFKFAILKWDLKTPGREDDDDEADDAEKIATLANNDFTAVAQTILEGLGGKENVVTIDNCITRLRLTVKDDSLVDDKKIKSAGVSGVMHPGKNNVQVVIGMQVQFVADEFKKLCK